MKSSQARQRGFPMGSKLSQPGDAGDAFKGVTFKVTPLKASL
jgi:hypothetical protein